MRTVLKINFADFWPDFNPTSNYFWDLLSTHYTLHLSDEPDILFFSVFGKEHKKYNCLRVFFTGECYKPNYNAANLSLSFFYDNDPRNHRFPLYLTYCDIESLTDKPDPEAILQQKTKFCSFVVSNKKCKERNEFFKKLSAYKKVDSGGRYLNNIGRFLEDKIDFIKDYKFVISFENFSFPGYTTEKLVEPMTVNSIPIYWGNPLVSREFNTKSFINVHDYKSMDEAIDAIIRIDQDDELYKSYLKEPWLNNNTYDKEYTKDHLLKRLIELINQKDNPALIKFPKESLWFKITDRIERKMRGERRFKL